jgi:hypothetical protein
MLIVAGKIDCYFIINLIIKLNNTKLDSYHKATLKINARIIITNKAIYVLMLELA